MQYDKAQFFGRVSEEVWTILLSIFVGPLIGEPVEEIGWSCSPAEGPKSVFPEPPELDGWHIRLFFSWVILTMLTTVSYS